MKKAQQNIILKEIMYGVFVLILLVLIISVVMNLIDVGGDKRVIEANAATQATLAKRIIDLKDELIKENVNFKRDYNPFQFAGDEHIIVGFPKGDPNKVQLYSRCADETVSKKYTSCSESACLCLYEETTGDDFDDSGPDKPIICITIKDVDYLFTPDYKGNAFESKDIIAENFVGRSITIPNYPTEVIDKFAEMIIYSDCSYWDDDFEKGNLYLEAFKDKDNKISIMVAGVEEGADSKAIQLIERRIDAMDKKFKTKKSIGEYKKEIENLVKNNKKDEAVKLYKKYQNDYPKTNIGKDTLALIS